MKQLFYTLLFLVLTLGAFAQADQLDIVTTDQSEMKLDEYLEDGKNNLIIFWASWCSICRNEKNTLESFYSSWVDDYNTNVVSISTDVESARPNAVALFDSNDWPYDLVFATSANARTAFNASGVPYTFLLNAENEIIYTKRSFSSGDETEIDRQIKDAAQTSNNDELDSKGLNFTVSKINDNSLEVSFSSETRSDLNLNLYQVNGVKIHQARVSSGASKTTVSNVSLINTAPYIVVELVQDDGTKISKLVSTL